MAGQQGDRGSVVKMMGEQRGIWREEASAGGDGHREDVQVRACSVSYQSMWIEWDWMGLNPKQVKPLLNFFQSHPIHVYWE
jgi:hypothetical protein